jgi:hypothetical protein
MLGTIKRFAMNPKVLNFIRPALANDAGKITAGSLAGRFAPDAVFGALAAAQTPGDIGDKAIAFGASTLGGGLGGAGLTALTRGKLGMVGEMVGGFGGDYLGMMAGDTLSRGKDRLMGGEGLTAWERMGAEQQSQYAQELEQQILAQYGLLPGTREQYAVDPSTGYGVA